MLSEIRKQWLSALYYFAFGVTMASLAFNQNKAWLNQKFLITGVVFVLSAMVALTVFEALWIFLSEGKLRLGYARLTSGQGSDGRTGMTYIAGLLLPILLADLIGRAQGRNPLTHAQGGLLVFLLVIAFFCLYLLQTRNGVIEAAAVSSFALVLFAKGLAQVRGLKGFVWLASVLFSGVVRIR